MIKLSEVFKNRKLIISISSILIILLVILFTLTSAKNKDVLSTLQTSQENQSNNTSSTTLSTQAVSSPPVTSAETVTSKPMTSDLLTKYKLSVNAHAWNDYMPHLVASGETTPTYPKSNFYIHVKSTNHDLPNINIKATITKTAKVLNFPLTADPIERFSNSHCEQRFFATDASLISMEDGETLDVSLLITINGEQETINSTITVAVSS
jgi:hypothetical protein